MVADPLGYDPHSIEADVLSLWKGRRLPPEGGVLGPSSGPTVREFAGAWTQGDFPSLVAHRAVAADVDARYLGLVGRRAVGTLRQATGTIPPSGVTTLLTTLGIWTGGDGRNPWDSADRTAGVQAIVGRLASQGALVTRDESFRVCPTCGSPRSPERIVYDEQEGDTYLVQFPLHLEEGTVNALVWVDAPWKLLGTSALLVNPEHHYVVAGYQRREVRELVLTSARSIDRLRAWIPEANFEVVRDRPGRDFQGVAYTYPLRHEFPMGGDLTPPAGTILAVADVSESGTGIVPLVPGHGPTDARIASRLGVDGWPLVTPKGKLDFTLMHKYAGLDLDTANEFVLRDLSEAGALLAHLRVRRGVPYCALCGTTLLWTPGRAWCLEPSRLPAERRALFSRLLPGETMPGPGEVAPWPVSEAMTSDEATAVALLECTRCDRLDSPEGAPVCSCGGPRTLVRRRLLPSSGAAFAAWSRFDPFPDGDSIHLYVGERRRVPALVNHLAAMSGVQGSFDEVELTLIPSVAPPDVSELAGRFGADAVRAALVRSAQSETPGTRFADRCRQEADRLRRWWVLSREVVAKCDPAMLATFARPIGGFLAELEVEDRSILARWERTRSQALAHYDHWAPALVHRRAFHFFENDLLEYRELVEPRLALAGTPTSKRSALRTLAHLLRGLSEVLAPILPFTSESVHRSLSTERTSVFERPMAGLDQSLLNDELVAAWDRWRSVLRSVERFRRSLGVARTTVLPSAVLVLAADDVADRFRSEKETLARLARIQRLEIASPRDPWTGRQRTLRPVESEIQKAYPAQASQIIHLLQRMAPRRWEAALGQEELTVVVDGLPRRVFPTMVAFSDTLPARVVPFAWRLGEMYLELPTGASTAEPAIPPLSPDAYWLVRRIRRRLRTSPAKDGAPPRVALVTAKDPLASELKAVAGPVATYLHLGELRVVEKSEEVVPPTALTGRTRTGERWWVDVPGLPGRTRREKRPRGGTRLPRVSVAGSPVVPKEFDYADEKYVAHEEEVRALGQELDTIIGLPVLGPSKIAVAWEQGLHSVDDLRHASFETVSALPGFGGPVAEVVVLRLGGSVPPRAARSLPVPVPRPSVPSIPPPVGFPPVVPSLPPSTAMPLIPVTPPLEAGVPPAVGPSIPSPAPTRPEPVTVPVPPPTDSQPPVAQEVPISPSFELPVGPSVTEVRDERPVQPEPEEESSVPATPQTSIAPEPPSEEAAPVPLEPPSTAGIPSPEGGAEAELPAREMEEAPIVEPIPTDEIPIPEADEPLSEETPPSEGTQLEEPVPAVKTPSEPELPPSDTAETPTPTSSEQSGTGAPIPELVDATPPGAEDHPTEPADLPPPAGVEVKEEEPLQSSLAPENLPTVPEVAPVPEQPPETGPTAVDSESPPPAPPEPEAPSSPVEAEPESPSAPSPAPTGPQSPPEPTPPSQAPTSAAPPSGPAPAPVPSAPLWAAPVAPEPIPPAPPAGVELTVGDSLVTALGGFLESTGAGHHGVCVVRESPERIRARVGSRPIEVLWLTNIGRGPALRPSDLEGAWAFLHRKLVEERVTAFFLEGIEYLVRLHGPDAVLNGLVEFDRLARENDARIWVCLTPALMKPADFERFRSTFGGGPPPT